ncbi:MAG TPA: GNAT family N-acetyltransferase [Caulobacteraceae bacterium]|jgi:aminoglycoside 6'-N-acetyltransferase|nr:GNAT family N-acetyltransferase [Caulobacteraceae bacterium]
MAARALPLIGFHRVSEADFPLMTGWLAQPHVRVFFQKTPISLDEVAAKYGPRVRGENPTHPHLALYGGRPFGYLQCYRNVDWPEWAAEISVEHGLSIDLYIGDPAFVGAGYGRAMLGAYVREVAFPLYPDESRCFIAHTHANTVALACSRAVGFHDVGDFVEDGVNMRLLVIDR